MDRETVIALAVLLGGCGDSPPSKHQTREADQCLRREVFMQCLSVVPKGPEVTKYNDWDEVVAECAQSAYYISLRQIANIKEECRP